MRTTFLFILFFAFHIVSGQHDSTKIYKNQLKFSPARIVSAVRGIQISYERKFSKRFSTQLTGAYIVDLLPYHYLNISNMKGFIIGLEERFFLKKIGWGPKLLRKKNCANYLSADFTILNSSLSLVDDFIYQPSDTNFTIGYTDTIGVRRQTYTFSFKYGFQFSFRHFIVDLNLGLGIRYRAVTHSNKLHQNAEIWQGLHANGPYELFRSGQAFSLNIPLGLKIGYTF